MQENKIKNILAIDPGNIDSAWCFISADTLRPKDFSKDANECVLKTIAFAPSDAVVIERVASYGMAVGKEVFETCEWIGRFTEAAIRCNIPVAYIYRLEEKTHICHDSRAKDANIHRALIDRFAKHDLKTGRGTKKNPDWFYGFHDDIWSAYAVGITFVETKVEGNS